MMRNIICDYIAELTNLSSSFSHVKGGIFSLSSDLAESTFAVEKQYETLRRCNSFDIHIFVQLTIVCVLAFFELSFRRCYIAYVLISIESYERAMQVTVNSTCTMGRVRIHRRFFLSTFVLHSNLNFYTVIGSISAQK
jgi:hypothetical protein